MHPLPLVERCLAPEQLSSASSLPIVSNYMHCCWERLFQVKRRHLPSFHQGHTDELSWEIPVTERNSGLWYHSGPVCPHLSTHSPWFPGGRVCVLVSRVWLFAIPRTIAHQVLLSVEFSRQEYWSGLPFPSPGDLPDPVIKLGSPTFQVDSLPSEPPGKPLPVYSNEDPAQPKI